MFGRRIQFVVIGLLIITRYIHNIGHEVTVGESKGGRRTSVYGTCCCTVGCYRTVSSMVLLVVVVYGKQLFMLLSMFPSYSITVCNLLVRTTVVDNRTFIDLLQPHEGYAEKTQLGVSTSVDG
jgi:hypothetical protein